MEVIFKDKFNLKRKQSTEFIEHSYKFIKNSLVKYLPNNTKRVLLEPLGGGIKGVVYKITFDNKEPLVLKICLNKKYYWNELVGYHYAKKLGIPTLEPQRTIEDSELEVYGFISNYIDAPILGSTINDLDKRDLNKVIAEFGEITRTLHNQEVNGFDDFSFGSYTQCESDDPYYYKNFMLKKDNYNYLLEEKVFEEPVLKELYVKLKNYEFKDTPKLTHGDLSIDNCFITKDDKPILFDYQCNGGDPMYDLATFKYKAYLISEPDLWEGFISGYGNNFDEDMLNTLIGVTYFRKVVNAHKNGNTQKVNFFKEFLVKLIS